MLAGIVAKVGAQEAQQQNDTVYLWPCNVPAWAAWRGVQTQWRIGPSGAITGLDYAGVRAWLDEQQIDSAPERKRIFAGIQAAERGALSAVAKKLADKQQAAQPHP